MIKKIIFLWSCMAICLTLSLDTFAQKTTGDAPPGDSNVQVASIDKLNKVVNESIAKKELYNHRVTLNSSGGTWPGLSAYQETLDCYFTIKENAVILKKIIVLAKIANRSSYTDFLFDAKGNVTYCLYNHDIASPSTPKEAYHFLGRKMVNITLSNETRGADEFITSDSESGAAVLQQGDAYARLFRAMAGVQLRQE